MIINNYIKFSNELTYSATTRTLVSETIKRKYNITPDFQYGRLVFLRDKYKQYIDKIDSFDYLLNSFKILYSYDNLINDIKDIKNKQLDKETPKVKIKIPTDLNVYKISLIKVLKSHFQINSLEKSDLEINNLEKHNSNSELENINSELENINLEKSDSENIVTLYFKIKFKKIDEINPYKYLFLNFDILQQSTTRFTE